MQTTLASTTHKVTLATKLEQLRAVIGKFLPKLTKLGILTVKDLLWHFPTRYEDYRTISKIVDLKVGQAVTIRAEVKRISVRKAWNRNLYIVEAILIDETGGLQAVWFNQPYLTRVLKEGMRANFAGKILFSKKGIFLSNPSYEILRGTTQTKHTAGLIPVYPETRGLTSKGVRYLTDLFLNIIGEIEDFLPEEILEEFELPVLWRALHNIHFPKTKEQANLARKRFNFEYLFLLQLNNQMFRRSLAKEKALPLIISDLELKHLLSHLTFTLMPSQQQSLKEILADIALNKPMNRLLQGDVGSGKTVVAAMAALTAAQNKKQAVFMAPTEVLARQHYKTFTSIFKHVETGIGLLTGSEARVYFGENQEKKITKPAFKKAIGAGEIKIIIGTHALIAGRSVKGTALHFPDLGLVIVDEQHRFGVSQRKALARGQAADTTQTNADQKLLYEDLTYKIRGCIFAVKDELGLGQKETIYQKALVEEFKRAKLAFQQEKTISIMYGDKKIGTYRPDFIIENKIILETKALPSIGKFETRQLWHYLKSTNYKLALLVNFSPNGVDIKRVIYESARKPRKSASSPRVSASMPHFLSMSATPIPRTLTLTVFGDLDLSTITELPLGRKPIVTKIVDPLNRAKAYGFIKENIKRGRQAFLIYPRIDPAQTTADGTRTNAENNSGLHKSASRPHKSASLWADIKNVKEEFELLKKIFPEFKVGMLHGKLKPAEKKKVMQDFSENKIQILATTSVVEVGVDIKNATIMVIEGADRFGLSQLYQFRGRVGRGEHQSFCFLFTDSKSETAHARLKALLEAKNGFELAEKDLALRGPGEFLGERQTGVPDNAMTALADIQLIKMAQDAAKKVLANDPDLSHNPLLEKKLAELKKQIHLE